MSPWPYYRETFGPYKPKMIAQTSLISTTCVGEIGPFRRNLHGQIDTPNIDQFVEEGIRFTSAYAGYTVCAPMHNTVYWKALR